jgi:hypothetical protein
MPAWEQPLAVQTSEAEIFPFGNILKSMMNTPKHKEKSIGNIGLGLM